MMVLNCGVPDFDTSFDNLVLLFSLACNVMSNGFVFFKTEFYTSVGEIRSGIRKKVVREPSSFALIDVLSRLFYRGPQ